MLFINTASEAIDMAGLDPEASDEYGVIESCLLHPAAFLQEYADSPSFWLKQGGDAGIASLLAICQLKGPSVSLAGGVPAISEAYRMIKRGEAQALVVAASAIRSNSTLLDAHKRLRTLSKTGQLRCFDKSRDGTMLGEGAASLVLENYEHAVARNATIYAEVTGIAHSFKPASAARVSFDNSHLQRCLVSCVPDLVIAHGAGTQAGDEIEANILQELLGDVPITSIKPCIGNLISASGLAESVIAVLAIKQQILPPLAGLEETDFELNFVKRLTRASVANVLVHAIGIDGKVSAVTFSKCK